MSNVRGRADFLDLGNYNAQCYRCGRKRKASELVKHWQGFYVCYEHTEPRHPQDFVRPVADIQTPPWIQSHTEIFVSVCSPNGRSAVPGYAEPGCVIPGLLDPAFYPTVPFF